VHGFLREGKGGSKESEGEGIKDGEGEKRGGGNVLCPP